MYDTTWARLVRAFLRPEIVVRQVIRRLSLGSLEFRLSLQALDRPQYAFGVKQAIWLASKLNHPKVSVIEFGVANGEGLLTLEAYAAELGKLAGVEVEVYGFDTGYGLPAPSDYRDLGYVWKRGEYRMDVEGLRKRLSSAQLILGKVEDSLEEFLKVEHAPIGFISFDLDYYSSTVAAFRVFCGTDKTLLPRVVCYFDDVLTNGHQLHCDRVGELLAIREFNEAADAGHTLAPLERLNTGFAFPALWTQQLWVYHRFQHVDYNTYVGSE